MVADNHHRFCGYDRANTGTSDKVPGPRSPEDRWDHTEWKTLEEQVDQLTAYQQAHALLGKEPAIPVTYLLARHSSWTGPAGYEAVVEDYIAKDVDRFSPGVKDVQSPHHMEEAVPERVVQELEKVIANP